MPATSYNSRHTAMLYSAKISSFRSQTSYVRKTSDSVKTTKFRVFYIHNLTLYKIDTKGVEINFNMANNEIKDNRLANR